MSHHNCKVISDLGFQIQYFRMVHLEKFLNNFSIRKSHGFLIIWSEVTGRGFIITVTIVFVTRVTDVTFRVIFFNYG